MDFNGLKIRQLLLSKKIRNKEVADKLGISKQAWSNALYRNSLKEELIPVLCSILEVRIEEIGLGPQSGRVEDLGTNYSREFNPQEIINLAKESIKLANGMMVRFDKALNVFEKTMEKLTERETHGSRKRTGT